MRKAERDDKMKCPNCDLVLTKVIQFDQERLQCPKCVFHHVDEPDRSEKVEAVYVVLVTINGKETLPVVKVKDMDFALLATGNKLLPFLKDNVKDLRAKGVKASLYKYTVREVIE